MVERVSDGNETACSSGSGRVNSEVYTVSDRGRVGRVVSPVGTGETPPMDGSYEGRGSGHEGE